MSSPQPTDPQALTDGEQHALAALTGFLAEAALVGTIALPPYVYAKLLALGLDRRAIRAAAALTLRGPIFRRPASGPRQTGTAQAQTAAQEPAMRALYLLNAATRMTRDLRTLIPPRPGEKLPPAAQRLADALRRERRYWRMHVDAQRRRRVAAHAVDKIAQNAPTSWLAWQTMDDSRVDSDCRALAGTVFPLDQPPTVHGRPTFPGQVHPRCRCIARAFGATPIRTPTTATR